MSSLPIRPRPRVTCRAPGGGASACPAPGAAWGVRGPRPRAGGGRRGARGECETREAGVSSRAFLAALYNLSDGVTTSVELSLLSFNESLVSSAHPRPLVREQGVNEGVSPIIAM
jgi:hypothetical protein